MALNAQIQKLPRPSRVLVPALVCVTIWEVAEYVLCTSDNGVVRSHAATDFCLDATCTVHRLILHVWLRVCCVKMNVAMILLLAGVC